MRAGRVALRRRRRYRDAVAGAPVDRVGVDYNAAELMSAIDGLERPWRDLVNEHGFTAVAKVCRDTDDLAVAETMLRRRHRARQEQLARGEF